MARICTIPDCSNPHSGRGYCRKHYSHWKRHGDPLKETGYGRPFWDRVDKSGECWVWTALTDRAGYGRIFGLPYGLSRQPVLAHRVSWLLTHGELDPDLCVLHHCDNPPCVRPDHLFLGTNADNSADMVQKGRGNTEPARKAWKVFFSGENNFGAKLTDDQVMDLRRRAAAGEFGKPLAKEFGISASTAQSIIRGDHWQHLPVLGSPNRKPRSNSRQCSVDGCERSHYGRGFCNMHYQRWRAAA